jgi:hypothetical protein
VSLLGYSYYRSILLYGGGTGGVAGTGVQYRYLWQVDNMYREC